MWKKKHKNKQQTNKKHKNNKTIANYFLPTKKALKISSLLSGCISRAMSLSGSADLAVLYCVKCYCSGPCWHSYYKLLVVHIKTDPLWMSHALQQALHTKACAISQDDKAQNHTGIV